MALIKILLLLLLQVVAVVIGLQYEALDQTIWQSRLTVYYEDDTSWMNPFLCEFHDVFLDATTIYLKAKDPVAAGLDLYECALNPEHEDVHYYCPTRSVHHSLRRCFHTLRYFPTLARPEHLQFYETEKSQTTKSAYFLTGNTWMMNHYCWGKNPDHFGMKILEVRGLMGNRPWVNESYYQALPKKVDHLVSQDYPLDYMNDYEKLLLKLVWATFGQEVPYFSLNQKINLPRLFDYVTKAQKRHYICEYLKESKVTLVPLGREEVFNHLKEACNHHSDKPFLKLPLVWYAENVYLSPRYKNNIPKPHKLTVANFQENLNKVLQKEGWTGRCRCKESKADQEGVVKKAKPIIAVLQRADGNGLRRMLNLHEVIFSIQSVFQLDDVQVKYITTTTPPVEQMQFFLSFDLLVATHSSQLTNLIFAREGSYVVEIQPEQAQEWTFQKLGNAAGLHYFVLNEGHSYDKANDNGRNGDRGWLKWDYYVNTTLLVNTLTTIKAKMMESNSFDIAK